METKFLTTPCLNKFLQEIVKGNEGPKIKMTTSYLATNAHITWRVRKKIFR